MYYVDLIGFYGPVLLGVLDMMYLWIHRYYVTAFVSGYIGTFLLNGILKHLIREPRPADQLHINGHDQMLHADRFGMPSGHAQMTGYAVTFLYLVINSPFAIVVAVFIGSLTIFQRYKYRRHTATQLVIGLLIGSITATVFYELTKYRLESNITQLYNVPK